MAAVIGSNSIPEEDARRLISAHNGNVALLYVWQSLNGHFDAEAAARDLCMTSGEISDARERLERLFSSVSSEEGRSSAAEKKAGPTESEPPQYGTDDVKIILESAADFKSVVEEAARILGRSLSTPDIATLLAIYDHLGVPAEVMMELINYCHESSRERFGPSKRVSVNYIYKEACRWADEGILSFEAAEDYIARQKELSTRLAQVTAMLNLDPRHITDTPLKYIRSWISLGFDDQSIAEAYDRTFTNTGNLSWKYMDAILNKWHIAGLHTIDQIKSKDVRKGQTRPGARKTGGVDKDAVAAFLNDSKNKD
ncbi:MAG: DnaD domain protein [Oscillospiraceae bacterium]|nr:DnaD domain protein [Oscillospiraceae bacterium]